MPPEGAHVRRRAYVMHGAIAAGGMATVYFGRLLAPGGFARNVAIKRLHPHFAADPELRATFSQEARLAARVTHANVVAMLDVVAEDDELLLVMEYVHGESLSRLLRTARTTRSPVPAPIVASVLADVLHGLHAAHEAVGEDGVPLRLVHRDVSPQNVIVGADGVSRVVDFGIAKAMASGPITRDGALRGKMPYMAPEQLLRRGIDRGVDVYAAGVILWEALAGKRLFEGDDESVLFNRILEEPIAPPSRYNAEVPEALDAIVLRALARRPESRFATARDMALAIESETPHAPSSAVAAWVAKTAHAALEKRAAQLAEMERQARPGSEDTSPGVRAPYASVLFVDAAAPSIPPPSSAPPSVAPPSAPTPSAPPSPSEASSATIVVPPPRRRRALASIAIVALLVVGLGTFILGRYVGGGDASARVAAEPNAPAANAPVEGAPIAPPAPSASSAPVVASAPEAPGAPALAHASAPAVPSMKWCKVFDSNKRIFVVKPMRVARCP